MGLPGLRGTEHIGFTVPDLDEALRVAAAQKARADAEQQRADALQQRLAAAERELAEMRARLQRE